MSITLRPYQDDLISEARELMKSGVHSLIIQAATGAGKTALAANMLKLASSRGKRCWFIVHRRELIKQSLSAFEAIGVECGVISAGFKQDLELTVQVCSIQSLKNRLSLIQAPELIVWDECHHTGARTWEDVYNLFPKAFHIGLTATPCRLDGKGLDKFFKAMACGPSMYWLIQNGFLSKYKIFAPPPPPQLKEIKTVMGDFDQTELAAVMDKPKITGCAIEHYNKVCPGKRAIIFCINIEHSEHVVAQFIEAGISASHVDGKTKPALRDAAIDKFRTGEIKILSNVGLFGEGFDVPAAEAVLIMRPTKSLSLYLQQVGRVLRPSPGKDFAIILDHAGNTETHGLPDDDREWTLEGRKKKTKEKEVVISVRVCKECYAAFPSAIKICPECGFENEPTEKEIEQNNARLAEIDIEERRRKKQLEKENKPANRIDKAGRAREMRAAKTREDLILLGRKRGYKWPSLWAGHILRARGVRG